MSNRGITFYDRIHHLSDSHLIKTESFALTYRRRQWHPPPVLLPGKSHGRRSLVGCSPRGRKESDTTERLHFHFSLSCIGGGNGNPLQCSCLENPRDGEAWWAAICGVAQSRTWLKRLSSSSIGISLNFRWFPSSVCLSHLRNRNRKWKSIINYSLQWNCHSLVTQMSYQQKYYHPNSLFFRWNKNERKLLLWVHRLSPPSSLPIHTFHILYPGGETLQSLRSFQWRASTTLNIFLLCTSCSPAQPGSEEWPKLRVGRLAANN